MFLVHLGVRSELTRASELTLRTLLLQGDRRGTQLQVRGWLRNIH